MNSPFPGMDPYLEQHWRDVHHALVTYARDSLQSRLPDRLRARMEERVFVESENSPWRVVYPDVRIIERPGPEWKTGEGAGGIAVAEPVIVDLEVEPMAEGYIEIIDAGSGNRVVTVIEFLSPSNKIPGQGQDLYLQKQGEVLAAKANLVEIDLTRAGRRITAVPPERIPPAHRTTYQICVWRGWRPSKAEVYAAPLQHRLPSIRIPLRETDEDVPLDLQDLIEQAYRNGRYDDLDYKMEPSPPLDVTDAAWADELLRSKGLR